MFCSFCSPVENRQVFCPPIQDIIHLWRLVTRTVKPFHQSRSLRSPENKTAGQKHLEEFLLPSLLLLVFSFLKEMNGVLIGLLIFWGVFKRLVVYFHFYLNKISSCILSVWGHKNSNNKLNERLQLQVQLRVTPKNYSHLCLPQDLSKITMKQSGPFTFSDVLLCRVRQHLSDGVCGMLCCVASYQILDYHPITIMQISV